MHAGYKPKNHPRQTAKRGADDTVDDRETSADVFEPLHAEYGFTLDVAAARHNAKCKRFYAKAPWAPFEAQQCGLWPEPWRENPDALALDGLAQPWGDDEVVWCNPPFSDLYPWVEKAHHAKCTVVMLLPANRAEQPWWQDFIEPFRDRALRLPETRFLAGRRTFAFRGEALGDSGPTFGIVIVIWDRRRLTSERSRAVF
jgi:hypothetical protein